MEIKKSLIYILICFLGMFFASCSSTKKIKYFQDIPDSGKLKTIARADYTDLRVQVDDIITVIVQTIDPVATQNINMGNMPTANPSTMVGQINYSQQTTYGYLVDKNGDIEIPVLGKLKVVGLTSTEVTEVVRKRANQLFNNATVTVRFANFKVSVIGEVLKPGVYVMPNERVTLLDAIAMAGDLTIYGKRENVLLIRQNQDGTKSNYRFNLKDSKSLTYSANYLRQNDIIYVEPGKGKAAATDASQARYYTLIGSLLSVLIVFFTRK